MCWFQLLCWCTYMCTDRGWTGRVVCRTVQGAHHIVSRLEGKYLHGSSVPLEVRVPPLITSYEERFRLLIFLILLLTIIYYCRFVSFEARLIDSDSYFGV